MPGWEPERMEKVKELFELYKDIDEEKLFENLKYFLEAIMPVCDKYDINMAIHPDDPSWSVFGLPRIISSQAKLKRLIEMVPNKHNGVTFCMGSYGTNLNNDLVATVKMLKGRIHFAHIRNLRFNDGMRDFEESAHLSSDGTFDMHAVMKALYETGFEGPIRNHGSDECRDYENKVMVDFLFLHNLFDVETYESGREYNETCSPVATEQGAE